MNAADAPKVRPSANTSDWILATGKFDNSFEAEAFVGNGLLGLRVPAAGAGFLGGLGKVGWPIGTERVASAIAAGVYGKVAEGTFYKEPKQAIALIPNWSTLNFGDASGEYSPMTVSAADIANYKQSLDLRSGTVTTSGTWTAPGGQKTKFAYQVFTDRANGAVAVVKLELTPQWTGDATLTSALDEAGARRLDKVSAGADAAAHSLHLLYRSIGTKIDVAEAARIESTCALRAAQSPANDPTSAIQHFNFQAHLGKTCTFTKYVAVETGRESQSPEADAIAEAKKAAQAGLAALEGENRTAWDEVWKSEIQVEGDPDLQQALRANEYTLFASIADKSPMSLGPSGLSSDGYAGMVFWDADTWMFPALLAQHPDLARVMVDYRSSTLPAVEKNATANGYRGAMHPWTSGISGDMGDECYGAVTDSSGKVIDDPNKSCTQQLHLQSDVALAQWEYYEATGDKQWLKQRGWPVLKAVAEFWESKVTPVVGGGYAINNVQTPDEYATDTNNDAYTNAEVALELHAAIEAAKIAGELAPTAWDQIAAGVTKTMEIDQAKNIYVEHEGYTSQKIKQADVVMLTYPLNFAMPKAMAVADLDYYTPRTDVDGPAMTDAIHAIASATVDAPGCSAYTYLVRSYRPFLRAPFQQFSEFAPVRLTATSYDFLTGVGGFMQEFLFGFSGFRPQVDAVRLDPNLPPQLKGLTLRGMKWQGRVFDLHIGPHESEATLISGDAMPIVTLAGNKTVERGKPVTLTTRRSDLEPTPNIARCGVATATSAQLASPAVAAVDGSPATAWVAEDAKASLTVKLNAKARLARVVVKRGSRDPFPYALQASLDGLKWTTVARAAANAPGEGAGTDELKFTPVESQYLRLEFAGGADAKPPVITELEAYAAQ